MNALKTVFAALCLAASSAASAAPLTLTGADLLGSAWVTFPTIQPTLSGDSLMFGQNGSLAKLMVLNLSGAGVALDYEQHFLVTVNFTRLPCSTRNARCAQSQAQDFDPYVLLGDGSHLLGGTVSDNGNGQGVAQELVDVGTVGAPISSSVLFTDAGFPAIGAVVEAHFDFTIGAALTTMRMGFNSGSATHTFANSLGIGSGQNLVLLKDNEDGERYQVNFVTLEVRSQAPEPATLALVGASLFGIAATRRRRPAAPTA
jgi:hypothetical protein